MKNEPHVIGDRVPHEHALIAELKLVVQGCNDQAPADVTHPAGFASACISRIDRQTGAAAPQPVGPIGTQR